MTMFDMKRSPERDDDGRRCGLPRHASRSGGAADARRDAATGAASLASRNDGKNARRARTEIRRRGESAKWSSARRSAAHAMGALGYCP
ncbi:hypothetical protein [Burkholderia sp. IMCC1007]|uniref:hypothetical protein n=1 Tax=Burkholderia sp. IMCC1007 TaxID=3004104 RepID=UPI0022B33547|nr:hypothetical protein [Burkholderia sp. IMCC1007]